MDVLPKYLDIRAPDRPGHPPAAIIIGLAETLHKMLEWHSRRKETHH